MKVLCLTTGYLYLLGGLLIAGLSYASGWGVDDIGLLRFLGVMASLLGLCILLLGPARLARWTYHMLLAAGSAGTAALILVGDGAPSTYALAAPMTFVVVAACYCCSPLAAMAHLVALMAFTGWAFDDVGSPVAPAGLMMASAIVVGVVVAWLARVSDIAERDPLTGLSNRRGHERALHEALEKVGREGGYLSLVLLDLDHFKEVNDTKGHLVGDQLLTRVAKAWGKTLESGVVLSRFGGDEFCMVLPGHSLGRAADIADQLRVLVPDVSVSAGVAAWQPGDSASMLMSRADVAMYDAKSAGRDRTSVYGDPERAASALEAAISAGELFLEFQPIVQLSDRMPVACEALVRWRHPKRGVIGPGDFVPTAERTGAIHMLGAWTLDQACACAVVRGMDRLSVSINVSIPELRNPDYPSMVGSTLYEHGLAAERLIVEVTEAVFDEQDPQVVSSLARLRSMGVQIALDDFGAGYSSLRWLENFPLDIVKVDRSFSEGLGEHRDRAPVLEGIMRIGRSLGFRVLVEGIESEPQAKILNQLGGQLGQGWLFAHPMPLDEFVRWLQGTHTAALHSNIVARLQGGRRT
jgi:diguanylate cyclase (GGDEF)-like protein